MTIRSIGTTRRILMTMGLALISQVCLLGQNAQADLPPQVQLSGTQVLHLSSAIVGQEYDLCVSLPRGYDDTTKHFPVIYVLDAQWDFALTYSIYGQQYYDGFIPAAIIVGITWGGNNPNHDSLRARDLTPTHTQELPQSGGAPKFLACIKGELIPCIEARFRTAPGERTLVGSSFGGLFTLYTLFHETSLFNHYVLTSPPFGWDNGVLFGYETTYFRMSNRLPVKLFMAVGGLELWSVPGFEKFVAQVKGRNYGGLDLETRILENTGHSGSKAEGYTRGLQGVFARPELRLSPGVLATYTGKYRVNPRFTIELVAENGNLVVLAPGNTRIPLLAESDGSFYVRGMYMNVHIRKDQAGKVLGVEVEQYSGSQYAEKVD